GFQFLRVGEAAPNGPHLREARAPPQADAGDDPRADTRDDREPNETSEEKVLSESVDPVRKPTPIGQNDLRFHAWSTGPRACPFKFELRGCQTDAPGYWQTKRRAGIRKATRRGDAAGEPYRGQRNAENDAGVELGARNNTAAPRQREYD